MGRFRYMNLLRKIRRGAGKIRRGADTVRRAMVTEIDFRRAKKTQLASGSLSREEKDWLERVSLKVHPNDGMYDKSICGSAHAPKGLPRSITFRLGCPRAAASMRR
jgi:hypothetical protein